MLAVFIQNHLTRFSIDFSTEGPVGKKQTLCCGACKQPTLLPQMNAKCTWKRGMDVCWLQLQKWPSATEVHKSNQEVAVEHVAL